MMDEQNPTTASTNGEKEQGQFEQQIKAKFTDKVMSWATVALSFITLGIGYIAYLQWHDSGKLTDAAQKAATAADNFKDSAAGIRMAMEKTQENIQTMVDSSKAAIDATQEAMRFEQRAWIVPKVAAISVPVGQVSVSRATITNTGRTPARNAWLQATVKSMPPDANPVFDYPDRPTARPRFGTIFPGDLENVTVNSSGIITDNFVNELQTKMYVIRFYGIIHYDDIFNRSHETKFCYSILPDLSTLVPCATYDQQSTIYNDAN